MFNYPAVLADTRLIRGRHSVGIFPEQTKGHHTTSLTG